MSNRQRIIYLDIAKGVLIILLVFAHFRTGVNMGLFDNVFFKYVYGWNSIFTCFYMPAFFIISGFCSSFKKETNVFLKSLFKNLILPLFALSLIKDLLIAVFVYDQEIFSVVINIIKSGGTLWFIQALIVAKLVCYIILKIVDSKRICLILTFVLLTLGIILYQFKIGNNPFYYQHGLVASFFVALGFFLKANSTIYESALKYSLYVYPLLSIINFWYSPSFTVLISVSLKSLPLFLVLSICGSLFLIGVCKSINKSKVLEYWGQNSLIVYALHLVPLLFFFKLYYIMIDPVSPVAFAEFLGILYITVYIVCYLLIKVFQYKPFCYLLGRKIQNRN